MATCTAASFSSSPSSSLLVRVADISSASSASPCHYT
jgi:hypothetical protein